MYLFLWLPHWEWTFSPRTPLFNPLLGWSVKNLPELLQNLDLSCERKARQQLSNASPQTYQCYQTMSRGSPGPTGWREGWAGMRMENSDAPPTPQESCFLWIKKDFLILQCNPISIVLQLPFKNKLTCTRSEVLLLCLLLYFLSQKNKIFIWVGG